MLSSFGLAANSNFPTAAFVPAKTNNDNMVKEFNLYNALLPVFFFFPSLFQSVSNVGQGCNNVA